MILKNITLLVIEEVIDDLICHLDVVDFDFLDLLLQVVLLLVTEIAPKSIAVHNATEVARVVVSC